MLNFIILMVYAIIITIGHIRALRYTHEPARRDGLMAAYLTPLGVVVTATFTILFFANEAVLPSMGSVVGIVFGAFLVILGIQLWTDAGSSQERHDIMVQQRIKDIQKDYYNR